MTPSSTVIPDADFCQDLDNMQVQEVFRQLHLDEPAVRRYYEMLEQIARQQEPPPVWLRTNIHSIAPPCDCY